ncbi:26879_t:CDS:2 [Dentiscutata erythropus]|uniref:Cytochrome b mRNA-processing protein 4 n=1 Tax=Dentiscutata erythropus TaxID=1348616 RepID=A0A9N9D424_9GLOM|nr:26879_t:CDS:2 [Dentiscutata erythropus]
MASQYVKCIIAGGFTLGFGYLLMKVVTPTKEQLYEKLSPDLKHKLDSQEQRENNVAVMELMKKVAESDKPIYDHYQLRDLQKEINKG